MTPGRPVHWLRYVMQCKTTAVRKKETEERGQKITIKYNVITHNALMSNIYMAVVGRKKVYKLHK